MIMACQTVYEHTVSDLGCHKQTHRTHSEFYVINQIKKRKSLEKYIVLNQYYQLLLLIQHDFPAGILMSKQHRKHFIKNANQLTALTPKIDIEKSITGLFF